ncbi:hypothetical protein RclHR1_00030005 [Rhizophagus clarus]|uniref:Uncharacterized protein n=1 Tax=Rhizophagus clarus TaxID=94130 RepID=A0A2Z6S034_9GLOM|nr:hypothetical protein RclHR1_00030005 [Rhizophagus clarus]
MDSCITPDQATIVCHNCLLKIFVYNIIVIKIIGYYRTTTKLVHKCQIITDRKKISVILSIIMQNNARDFHAFDSNV